MILLTNGQVLSPLLNLSDKKESVSMEKELKLFAVYLGGSAPKANIELHDVVFVTGFSLEETYSKLSV